MELRNLSHHTQRTYLAAVKGIAKHYAKSPDKISSKMVEDYLLHLKCVLRIHIGSQKALAS